MTIHFKNGTTLEVMPEIAEVLFKKMDGSFTGFQGFTDQHGNRLLMVNVNEIVYIK